MVLESPFQHPFREKVDPVSQGRNQRALEEFLGDSVVLKDSDGYIDMDGVVGYLFGGNVIFTSSGTFTKASYPGLRAIKVKVQAGGGGGAGCPATGAGTVAAGSGGGQGGYAESFLLVDALSSSETVTVGAGGAAGTTGNGGLGGASSFGAHAVCAGGGIGRALSLAVAGSAGMNSTGAGGVSAGQIQYGGETGHGCFVSQSNDRVLAGTGGGRGGGAAGSSSSTSAAGAVGGAPGAGGGGGANRKSQPAVGGGAGAAGIVIVELYY